jgi:hypothetical protein
MPCGSGLGYFVAKQFYNETMKKTLQSLLISACVSGSALAQNTVTGPSSSQSPYVQPVPATGYTITSVLTASTAIGSYTMSGLPDGLGAYDNNDGTFTLLMNHEFGGLGIGATHTHGSNGAFVSKWIINKSTLTVSSGTDQIQNANLWNTGTSSYSVNNSANSSTIAAFGRFCSADMAEVSAFYNSHTGMGTQERIFMNGEETGNEGRMMAHVATGPDAGNSYELPYLGKFSCENQVANPHRSDKTIVAGFDDTTPGQVYIYVGTKTNTGNTITKAGLTGGTLYGVAVTGVVSESNTPLNIPANSTFTLMPLPQANAITGASLNTLSNNLGVTTFLRPEDGAWDPSHPEDLYFNTTNAFNANSRLWRLRFTDIENPQLGGTITAVLDGTEGQQMMDNLGIDHSGHILIVEDVGNNAHNGKVWEYNIYTDALVQVAQHDPTRFISGGANFLTQDEEASGIIDAQSILGPGKFLFVDQSHYSIPVPVVEGGQLLVLHSVNTATSNPEVNVQGNSVSIPAGNTAISAGDFTDYGTVQQTLAQSRLFVIQNTGTGPLVVSSMSITGTNAADFAWVTPPATPFTVAAGASQNITVNFTAPATLGARNATISVNNNDFSSSTISNNGYGENMYDFHIQATVIPQVNVGINETSVSASFVSLYPNPTSNEAIVNISLQDRERVSISVIDLLGKVVISGIEKDLNSGNNEVSLNTTSLKNGVYFVQVTAGGKSNKIKMVVEH